MSRGKGEEGRHGGEGRGRETWGKGSSGKEAQREQEEKGDSRGDKERREGREGEEGQRRRKRQKKETGLRLPLEALPHSCLVGAGGDV